MKEGMDMTVVNKILDAKCIGWSKMTDDNCHSDLRQEICRYFALEIDGRSLEEAYFELQRANDKGANILYTQCFLDVIMLNKIAYEYGNAVANKVRLCLI